MIWVTCLIVAMVSSAGESINVNHLRYLTPDPKTGGCMVSQYYNPPVIHSDWSCGEVEESIIKAIETGCTNKS